MNGYDKILKRASLDSLAAYFLNEDVIPDSNEKDLYQKECDSAFEEIFDSLEKVFQMSCRDNEDVCVALSGFFMACKDAYFKAGLIAGFQIFRNLDKMR